MMLLVQVVVHFVALATGSALRMAGVDVNRLQHFKTPPFELLMALVGRVFSGNPLLYWNIQQAPSAEAVRRTFRDAADRLAISLASGNTAAFEKLHASAAESLGPTNLAAFQFNATGIFAKLASERTALYESKGRVVCVENVESGVIHYGVLENVSPAELAIRVKKNSVRLATKKARLLPEPEAVRWITNHVQLATEHVVFLCPRAAEPRAFAALLARDRGVAHCMVSDVYAGASVPQGFSKVSVRMEILPGFLSSGWEARVRSELSSLGCTVLEVPSSP